MCLLVGTPLVPWGTEQGARGPGTDVPGDSAPPFAIDVPEAPCITSALSSIAPSFVENRGQVANADVRFYAQGSPLSVGLTSRGIVYMLAGAAPAGPADEEGPLEPTMASFMMAFEGCNAVEPWGGHDLGRNTSFFIGNDPDRWVRGARSFEEVVYGGLYDGIDLRFYFRDGMLKYEYVLGIGSRPEQIAWRYDGLDSVEVDASSGDLLLRTPLGTIRDARPVVMGTGAGDGRLPIGFAGLGGGRWALQTAELPRDRPLVIDPGIEFSTTIGGDVHNSRGNAVAVDAEGNVYVAGLTLEATFPATSGAYNTTPPSATGERFVVGFLAKLDPTGSRLVYSTFIGGANSSDYNISRQTEPGFISVDSDGSLTVVGGTFQEDFPTTPDALQSTNKGNGDVFITVLDPSGTDLEYSTYFGGGSSDGYFINGDHVMTADGHLYIVGGTQSTDLPVTAGVYCASLCATNGDGYLLMLDMGQKSLQICSYLGGCSPARLAIDGDRNILITGTPVKGMFTTTAGAYCQTYIQYGSLCFMKFDPDMSELLVSSYFNDGSIGGLVPLEDGSVCLVGRTEAVLPTSSNAICATLDLQDLFLAVLDPAFSTIRYCTYLGLRDFSPFGTVLTVWNVLMDAPRSIIYIGGFIDSGDNLPCTPGCVSPYGGGAYDYYLYGVNISFQSRTYCTYLGGSASDYSGSKHIMALLADGSLVMTGQTFSADFPTTTGALDTGATGMSAFVARIDPRPCDVPTAPTSLVGMASDGSVRISWNGTTYQRCRMVGYRIYRGLSPADRSPIGTVDWRVNQFIDAGLANGMAYHYWVSAVNTVGEGPAVGPVVLVPTGPPTEPEGFFVRIGHRTANLTWAPPANDGGLPVLGYHVLRASDERPMERVATLGNVTGFCDMDVVCGARYWYAVSAFNLRGEGPATAPTDVVPMGPPSPPLKFMVAEGDGSVTLSWEPPSNAGGFEVTGYRVYRGTEAGRLEPIDELGPSTLSHVDSGRQNGATYHYLVTALSQYGEGDPTEVLSATPGTLPGPPREVRLSPGNRQVAISWMRPADDGGRTVLSYMIHYGESLLVPELPIAVRGQETAVVSGLKNGHRYAFAVAAVTVLGEGTPSAPLDVTPFVLPSAPTGLEPSVGPEGVLLTWGPPLETGGGEPLSYRIYRGSPSGEALPIGQPTDLLAFLDTGVEARTTYLYQVQAVSVFGNGTLCDAVSVTVSRVPGPVVGLLARAGDGEVELSWGMPSDDGGSPVIGYELLRGTAEGRLEVVGRLGLAPNWTDGELQNGVRYLYAVAALNGIGSGNLSRTVNATPLRVPLPVAWLRARASDGEVVLEWGSPPGGGSLSEVLGYEVRRGTSMGAMTSIGTVGPDVLTFRDRDVDEGVRYYYQVVPVGGTGAGDPSTLVPLVVTGPSGPAWVIYASMVLLVTASAIAALAVHRRRSRAGHVPDALGGDGKGTGATAHRPPAPPAPASGGPPRYIVEAVYVVYRDGRLISECSREDCKAIDPDLMSGMLIAVQGSIQDGFGLESRLESIKYGDNNILMASGSYVVLMAMVYGEPDDWLREELEALVPRVEGTYAGVIESWTGELATLSGMTGLVHPLIDRTKGLAREDVGPVPPAPTVSILSALDLHRGYVRLKLAVLNGTPDTITDVTVDLAYDHDMLRLERVEPSTVRAQGDRIVLGNVRHGAELTSAVLLDPLICQATHIDGYLMYHDARGVAHRQEMSRRQADVVCPIFFTKEHANTAMLRALVREKLSKSELRAFHYPAEVASSEMLDAGREALKGVGDTQLVREYVVEGPPFSAEVWYYGETKVKGYQMVMRLAVLEQDRALEFFAASTAMGPVTGLLAEFRKELVRVLGERAAGMPEIETVIDEDLNHKLENRGLLLDAEATAPTGTDSTHGDTDETRGTSE